MFAYDFRTGSLADDVDDLLQCDCLERDHTIAALQEKDTNAAEADDQSGSEDEDKVKAFVSATQYDPNPVRLCYFVINTRQS